MTVSEPIPPEITVIIPALNAACELPLCLDSVTGIETVEVLLVDGGSQDGTVDLLNQYPQVRLIPSARGRALQMNAGAAAASGEILLFLHADTVLETGWVRAVLSAMKDPSVCLGAFRFKLRSASWKARLLEGVVFLRNRLFQLPFGDQALFVRKGFFFAEGGFPRQPLFEDIELVWRAGQQGHIHVVKKAATTSAIRWEREGWIKRSRENRLLFRAYKKEPGSVDALARRYAAHSPALCVFCKYPSPGRVKTRLAKDVGNEKAARIYRMLVQHTLAEVIGSSVDARVFYDPPADRAAFRDWLGPRWKLMPQRGGDLGERLQAACVHCLDEGHCGVLLIGSDCPEIHAGLIKRAARLLDRYDLVIGPSHDGGYYLLGLKTAYAELFTDIPWSSDRVYSVTRQRADALGLHTKVLEMLHDVDTVDELMHCRLV